MPQPLTEKDLPKIRKEMQKIMRKNLPFVREEVSAAEARARIEARRPARLRWQPACRTACLPGGLPAIAVRACWASQPAAFLARQLLTSFVDSPTDVLTGCCLPAGHW
jgi:hypothetical protein